MYMMISGKLGKDSSEKVNDSKESESCAKKIFTEFGTWTSSRGSCPRRSKTESKSCSCNLTIGS